MLSRHVDNNNTIFDGRGHDAVYNIKKSASTWSNDNKHFDTLHLHRDSDSEIPHTLHLQRDRDSDLHTLHILRDRDSVTPYTSLIDNVYDNRPYVPTQSVSIQNPNEQWSLSATSQLSMVPKFLYKYYPALYNTLAGFKLQSYKIISYYKQVKYSFKRNLISLSMLLLAQSGDLHPNPGPYRPKFPCGTCERAVKWGQRAVCCDNCDLWYHVDCMDMHTPVFEALQYNDVSWICCQCGIPNFASSLFSDFSLNTSNNFSILTSVSTCTGNDTDTSALLSPPAATSSPKQRLPSVEHSRHVKSGNKSSRPPGKRQSIKTLVINFDGIKNKVANLAATIANYTPDVIIGTETHIDSSINSSELFPPDYSVYRKDRGGGISKGGVLIATRNDLIATHRIDLDTDCEIVWVTISIHGSKDVTIGAFYRSQKFGSAPAYMDALRESLSKINSTSNNQQIWLAGDFNMPDIDWETMSLKPGGVYANVSRHMIEIANDYGLEQIVRKPTRGENILDLFFTSNPTLVERSTTCPGLSDHDGVPLIIIGTKPKTTKQKPRNVFLYHKADMDAFRTDIGNWSKEFCSRSDIANMSVNEMYNEFQSNIQTCMDKHIPTKRLSHRNQSAPWINRRVRRLHKRKQRAYNTYKKDRNQTNYENFKKQRKITFNETRKAHRRHINDVCSDSPKSFWSYIKSLKVDSVGIPTLKSGGRLESDNKTKADILNDQFKSVFTIEKENLPDLPELDIPVMADIQISVDGVAKLLHDLQPNKAAGPDNISPKVLKAAANELAPALSLIFQKSLDTGELPDPWLRANITPLFKKGERTSAANYRPVSLTCICSKVLEHIIHSNIMAHFDHYSILTEKQHGFRSKHSCESQLILTVNDLAQCLDDKSQIDMIIMDFTKAFDSVPHNRLLLKLNRYGISDNIHRWIGNFLKHRVQRVVVGGEHSAWTDVVSGVPQGTVLGPLLFLIYINDLPDNIHSTVRLFADDCVLYHVIKNTSDSQKLQEDLNTLEKWEDTWQLCFNPSKCFVMRLTHSRSPKHFDYMLGNQKLSETDGHPYLGVFISNKLTWNQHVKEITSKANRTLGFIRRNLHSCPRKTKEAAYMTLVRPLIEYSSAVWDPHTQILQNQIEKIQNRAARFVFNDYTSRSPGCVSSMLQSLNWESLQNRRTTRRLAIFQQSRLGHLSLPIGKYLQPPQRQSRHHHCNAYQQLATNKDCFKHSYLPKTIIDWNKLPEQITLIEETKSFKQAVTNHLKLKEE